jgi:hypothetical protein
MLSLMQKSKALSEADLMQEECMTLYDLTDSAFLYFKKHLN